MCRRPTNCTGSDGEGSMRRGKTAEYHREYYWKNRERICENHRRSQRLWRARNQEKVRISRLKTNSRPEGRFVTLTRQAAKRGISLGINLSDYAQLVASAVCSYCEGDLPLQGHGLDRINRQLGYIAGNCVPCCTRCNEIKGYLEAAGFAYPRIVELLKERAADRTSWVSWTRKTRLAD